MEMAAATLALVVGLFSGVDMDHIMDTPLLARTTQTVAVGAEVLELGEGMVLGEHEGEAVAVTEEGFALEFSGELPAGMWSVEFEVIAFGGGADSFWVEVDGERLKRPLALPVDAMGKRAVTVRIEEAGPHTIRFVLREAPGSMIRRVELYQPSVNSPIAPMREELVGVHPRLLFTAEDLDGLRERMASDAGQRFYKPASLLTRKPPEFKPGKRNGGSFRSLSTYAFSHLMTGDEAQLAAVIEWLEMATTYPQCGVDLDSEYFMEGVALSYDWLYDELPEDLRVRVRDTIVRQCREVYQASLGGQTGGGQSFQQNHFWFAHLSMIMGAAAVYGEVPEAEEWLAWGWDRAERIFLTFGTDGGFHEGPGYWDYSMPTLYMLVDLYEWCTGEKIPWADQGLHGQAEFRFRHLYPGMKLSAALEDTSVTSSRPSRRLLLWEAKRFGDPVVMGMAEALASVSSDRFNLLCLDDTIQAEDPFEKLSLARRYEDIETAFARTSWDDDATSLALVSRPLGGHMWAELCDRFGIGGTGHNHPEQGHFVLFGRGEVLAGDPGYTYKKETRNHNTILVDGQGQYGDGEMWPRPKPGRAHLTGMVSDGDVTIIAADPSSAYPEELGLERFDRVVALAGRDLVVVCDRLRSAEPHVFSWLLHHYGEVAEGDGTWAVTRGEAQLTVAPVLPANVVASLETYRPVYIHPTRDLTPKNDPDISLIELQSAQVTEATFLVPLLIGDAGTEAPDVERLEGAGCDAVRVGETVIAFNREAGASMSAPTPWGEELATEARAVVCRLLDGERQVVSLEF